MCDTCSTQLGHLCKCHRSKQSKHKAATLQSTKISDRKGWEVVVVGGGGGGGGNAIYKSSTHRTMYVYMYMQVCELGATLLYTATFFFLLVFFLFFFSQKTKHTHTHMKSWSTEYEGHSHSDRPGEKGNKNTRER